VISSNDWTVKYSPETFDDLVVVDAIVPVIEQWKKLGEIDQNVLLAGSPGFGKTSLGMVAVETFNPHDFKYLNGGAIKMDVLEGEIETFLRTPGISGKKKILILDEIDLIGASGNSKAGEYLKAMIYENQHKCTFFGTTNNIHLLDSAILSRFPCKLDMVPSTEVERNVHMGKFYERAKFILDSEGVEFDVKTVKKMILKNYPDFRITIGLLQLAYNQYGKINSDALTVTLGIDNKLIEAIKGKNLEEIDKQLKCVSITNFFSEFRKSVFNLVEPHCVKDVLYVLGLYNRATPDDKEMNVLCCINEIINNPEFDIKWK
jgi:replication-associated recombination protein RarA